MPSEEFDRVTYRTRAVWVSYPTAAQIRAWTPRLDADHPHVVAEGIR